VRGDAFRKGKVHRFTTKHAGLQSAFSQVHFVASFHGRQTMFGNIVHGAGRIKPADSRRDWSHKKAVRAPLTGIAKDSTRRKVVAVTKYPPELVQAARALGMSAEKLKGMLALQRKFTT